MNKMDVIKLYKEIYECDPVNNEQTKIFIGCLNEKLSREEIDYLFNNQGATLGKKRINKARIRRIMRDYDILKRLLLAGLDDIDKMYCDIKEEGYVTKTYIQLHFSKGFISASSIIDEMLKRGLIYPSYINGKYLKSI